VHPAPVGRRLGHLGARLPFGGGAVFPRALAGAGQGENLVLDLDVDLLRIEARQVGGEDHGVVALFHIDTGKPPPRRGLRAVRQEHGLVHEAGEAIREGLHVGEEARGSVAIANNGHGVTLLGCWC
jgi:hypothetical protein